MNRTIVVLGLRTLLRRRRGVMLLVLPLILILLAVVVRAIAGTGPGADAPGAVLSDLGLQVLLPLIALVAATGLLSPEVDDGSVIYLLAKPVPRSSIVASKLVVAVGCTWLFAALPLLVAGLVLVTDDPGVAVGYAVGAVVGGTAYCALFLWLSTLTRHAVVAGLLYVLLWEGLIGGLIAGVRWLSINWWASAIVEALSDRVDIVSPNLAAAYAVIAALVVAAGTAVLATRRLQRFNLTGDE